MPNVYRVPNVPLAYEYLPGQGPVVVFCPGYGSDMQGTKALALEELCRSTERAMLRFDYAGHGQSGGRFTEGTIGSWMADAAHMIGEIVPDQDILLVGSSMGGWLALLLARTLGVRVKGLLLIAPAPDFTERLIRPQLTAAQLDALAQNGVIHQPSDYGEPQALSRVLLDDGKAHLLLDDEIPITCPVHILHGMNDADVPWKMSLTLVEKLASSAVRLTYVKDGDHRLSRPEDLRLLESTLIALLGQNGA